MACSPVGVQWTRLDSSGLGIVPANLAWQIGHWNPLESSGVQWSPVESIWITWGRVKTSLDLQKPLNTSIFTCLSTCFFATGWVGEFTIPKLDEFNPEAHVSKAGISYNQSRDRQQVTVLRIPCTKMVPQGEDVCWAKQDSCGPSASS